MKFSTITTTALCLCSQALAVPTAYTKAVPAISEVYGTESIVENVDSDIKRFVKRDPLVPELVGTVAGVAAPVVGTAVGTVEAVAAPVVGTVEAVAAPVVAPALGFVGKEISSLVKKDECKTVSERAASEGSEVSAVAVIISGVSTLKTTVSLELASISMSSVSS
jgi:hypothetical protein